MLVQMLGFFSWLLIAASAIGCAYLWYASHAVANFSRRVAARGERRRPVSVLKPLRGEDAMLADNLRSFCRQDYPEFQIVCGVADAADPAAAVVRRVIAEFPERDIALVVDARRSGANLKVANLANMLPSARHGLLVMADSDMRVRPDYLATVTAPLADPRIGLVTCLYRGLSQGGLWSDLACLHINHGFLAWAVVAEGLGLGAGCFGATIALRRATLDAAGGLAALADCLADDHVLGRNVRRLGLTVELSPYLVDDIVAEASFTAVFHHELRWARTIRVVAPGGFAAAVVTYPVALAVLAAASGAQPHAAPAMLIVAFLCRWLTARRLDRALRLKPAPVWLLPVRDALSFAVFIASFLGRGVAWRDQNFRIGVNGRLTVDGDSAAG